MQEITRFTVLDDAVTRGVLGTGKGINKLMLGMGKEINEWNTKL